MKRLKRRLSQSFRSNSVIEDSLSELTENMNVEENGTKDGKFRLRKSQETERMELG